MVVVKHNYVKKFIFLVAFLEVGTPTFLALLQGLRLSVGHLDSGAAATGRTAIFLKNNTVVEPKKQAQKKHSALEI